MRESKHPAPLLPFTGAEYLDSLNDGREVWIYGERVKGNIADHPAFRNSARMVARMYDALHNPAKHNLLTAPTASGGFTHRFFQAAHSAADQVAARDAIAEWQRISWGWMGRSPDYKGAFLGTLGANANFYKGFEDNAYYWYHKAQERNWFINHAVMHPPVDRERPTADGSDVFVHVTKETDAGIYVSGAKVVATNSVLTHYTFVGHIAQVPIADPNYAAVFMVPVNAPGSKLICRVSNEYRAAVMGSPFDYPLSSRLDENDAVLILDNVFVPWEDVFMHGSVEQANKFNVGSGFLERASLHGCTRFAVKMDFLLGLLSKGLDITGSKVFHGVQSKLGEIVAWRNTFWALSDAMCHSTVDWNGMVRPNPHSAGAYRVMNQLAMPVVKNTIEQVLGSSLVYLNSHVSDFLNPEVKPYLDKYLRGSGGIDAEQRVKVMKLMWDAIGSEFGGRHELYEINYIGSNDVTRLTNLWTAQGTGVMDHCRQFAESCMSEYDLHGWNSPDLVNPDDVNMFRR
ncbi:Pyoverdin chromophore biosynthetic protein pvcC [Salmonella enterica]|nr:Pyoverdin chromophore biosynthetic protein pvcC [Salmonella enterica]ELJ4842945.1 Pyoverdin chromophore biosynthetic protein pvcC [Salmonella enterica]